MRARAYGGRRARNYGLLFSFVWVLLAKERKREEKKRRKKKEEKERREEEKVARKLRLGKYPNFSLFVLLFLLV